MKIAFISPFIYRYRRGIERFTINISNKLAERGCLVDIITWYGNLRFPENTFHQNVRVIKVPYMRYYERWWAGIFYFFYLLVNKRDIVNIFFTWYGEGLALYILDFLKRQKFNIILPNPISCIPHRINAYKIFRLHTKADALIVRSHLFKDESEEEFNREVHIIPNGVDTRIFKANNDEKEKLREKFNIDKKAIIFLTVAAFEKRKGIKEFIEGLYIFLERYKRYRKEIKYFIIGQVHEKTYYEEVKEVIEEKKMGDIVIIFNSTSNILQFYQMSDYFVLLSSGEGCPNAFLEALSCGLPAIVSYECPFSDMVGKEYIFFIDKKETYKIAELIKYIVDNFQKRNILSNKARRYIEERFDLCKISQMYYELFTSITKKKR